MNELVQRRRRCCMYVCMYVSKYIMDDVLLGNVVVVIISFLPIVDVI